MPVPLAPALAAVRVVEAVGVPFPIRSESLRALQGLRPVPVAESLARLDLRVRPMAETLRDLFPAPPSA